MEITLNLLNKDDYLELLPKLFDILYNNMSIISPTKNTYAQDYEFWYNGKLKLKEQSFRQIIVMNYNGEPIGYFQYSVKYENGYNGDIFIMEEAQIMPKYQGQGLLKKFILYATTLLGKNIVTKVEAYSAKNNSLAHKALQSMGLTTTKEESRNFHFFGDYSSLLTWCNNENDNKTIAHYDLLVDENNDPVYDSPTLTEYMDKWDGKYFIDAMELSTKKDVLEIGVGTGRIALKVANACKNFCGIDISPKTIEKARRNLANFNNVSLVCSDFLTYNFVNKFDIIYSTLTFIHIKGKQYAIQKVANLLNQNGKFILSISKTPEQIIDYGSRKIKIYPDKLNDIKNYLIKANLNLINITQTEFALIIVSSKI